MMTGTAQPDRDHDVSGLTAAELEQARRHLEVSLALAVPGSPVHVPILAHLAAIDAELANREDPVPGSETMTPLAELRWQGMR